MDIHTIQSRLKPFMMPLAILLGVLFHSYIDIVAWIVPYLIFVMLFFTFCRIEPRDLKFHKEMWQLLAIQILGSIIVFLLLNFINPTLARSALVCVLCPVATAAPVVTGMLGGSIGRVASFSVLSNLSVALWPWSTMHVHVVSVSLSGMPQVRGILSSGTPLRL